MPEKLYDMVAVKGFANAKIKGPRNDGSVLPGEAFQTDYLHAKDLVNGKLAKPASGTDLDKEPTDPVAAHPGLSVSDHKTINDRRAKNAAPAKAPTPAPAAAKA